MERRWTIDGVVKVVEAALHAKHGKVRPSGRTNATPDKRTVRYYTTLGLLDRPLAMSGRTALYGRRHVLQLVCIKLLQLKGCSLTEIQEMLVGADDQSLTRWAGLPSGFWDELDTREQDSKTRPSVDEVLSTPPTQAAATRFWAQTPASTKPTTEAVVSPGLDVLPSAAIDIGNGVTVSLNGIDHRQLTDEVLEKLRPGVAALKKALADAGLSHDSNPLEFHSE